LTTTNQRSHPPALTPIVFLALSFCHSALLRFMTVFRELCRPQRVFAISVHLTKLFASASSAIFLPLFGFRITLYRHLTAIFALFRIALLFEFAHRFPVRDLSVALRLYFVVQFSRYIRDRIKPYAGSILPYVRSQPRRFPPSFRNADSNAQHSFNARINPP
jgi:hypothetical protein